MTGDWGSFGEDYQHQEDSGGRTRTTGTLCKEEEEEENLLLRAENKQMRARLQGEEVESVTNFQF